MTMCTRLTKRQRPCGLAPLIWTGITAVPNPRACLNHLTAAERAAYDQHEQAQADARRRHLASEPACWAWPRVEGAVDLLGVLAWQAGRCALCGYVCELVEDHDHRTGLVRGYLCAGCNTQEGAYRGAQLYERYRQRPPAQILGVVERYVHPITGEAAQPAAIEVPRNRWEETAGKGIGL